MLSCPVHAENAHHPSGGGERDAEMKPAFDKDDTSQRQDRLLTTLEGLLELSATEVKATLDQATSLIAEVLAADKVDLFFHDPASATLVALGTSDTPLGRQQRAIGMDRLPFANGGRAIEVFLTGTPFLTGHADQDPDVLVGMKVGLGVKSMIATVFKVKTLHRGVLLAVSSAPEFFSEQDLHFLEAIAHWVGIVIQRAELVERMKQEAMQQGRCLVSEELLTIIARDLHNYLTPLRGRIELLELRARREGREQDIRDVRALNHTLGLLEQVSADLLDVAGLNQGIFAIDAQQMKLMELVQEVVAAFSTAETPIHVHTPVEVVFSADPNRLRQLLENVLANAVTYAPKQTPIVVEVRIERRMDGPWMILTVSNQGPGLPPELLLCFFHPFVASSPSTGLGLGLYLANRIAAAHGGTLTIDSPAGQGVQITLALPIEEEELIVHEQEASDQLI
jgi:two-component system OmpR family sensor kinase